MTYVGISLGTSVRPGAVGHDCVVPNPRVLKRFTQIINRMWSVHVASSSAAHGDSATVGYQAGTSVRPGAVGHDCVVPNPPGAQTTHTNHQSHIERSCRFRFRRTRGFGTTQSCPTVSPRLRASA